MLNVYYLSIQRLKSLKYILYDTVIFAKYHFKIKKSYKYDW